jgi:hypothetical protein
MEERSRFVFSLFFWLSLEQTILHNSTTSQGDINFEIIGGPGIYLLEIETHQGKQARIRVIKN